VAAILILKPLSQNGPGIGNSFGANLIKIILIVNILLKKFCLIKVILYILFLDVYTYEIDKLLSHCNNQNYQVRIDLPHHGEKSQLLG